ncbi:MAG: cellulose synthase complex periplasmic endoglucanase BcsZ [Vibrio sp.]
MKPSIVFSSVLMALTTLAVSPLANAAASAETLVARETQDVVAVPAQCRWTMWDSFKSNYIENGRVVDNSDPRMITTSEGQSYGLFFALLANDKDAFAELLTWTENNLAEGDLTARLPAWLWGTMDSGRQGVIDQNSASDSDLWIAYSLMEAGRIWDNYYYRTLGHLLALRILKDETKVVDGVGTVLLPGRTGFDLGENHVRFNPSYVPMQILTRLAAENPNSAWKDIAVTSQKLILETMPKGFSPDWVEVTSSSILPDQVKPNIGSYDGIRTYLWAGMLSDKDQNKAALIEKMQPLVSILESTKRIPEKFDTQSGSTSGYSNLGLNASVIPLLMASGHKDLAMEFDAKIKEGFKDIKADNYYQNVLTLFSQGWVDGLYEFDETGKVVPHWDKACQ